MQTLNLKYFKDIAQGDENIEKEMLHLFFDSLKEEKSEYLSKYEQKEYVSCGEVLHKVKAKFKLLERLSDFEEIENYEKRLRHNTGFNEADHRAFISKIDEILNCNNERN